MRRPPLEKAAAHLPQFQRIIASILKGIVGFLRQIGFPNRFFPRWEWSGSLPTREASATVGTLPLWAAIITRMARGWESKSVEAQQDEAAEKSTPGKPRLTREAAARVREKESLRLSLQNVVRQLERSDNPRHRAMLERAQSDLERKIQELDA
jgi:hypothetical protein